MTFFIIIIIVLLAIIGICKLVIKGTESYGVSKYGEEEWTNIKASILEDELKKKYNNYMFTCPMCNSKNVKKSVI